MGVLKTFQTFYLSNATLCAAVPFERVYSGWLPPTLVLPDDLPYVAVNLVSQSFNWLTFGGNELNRIQISIFHTDLTALEGLIETFTSELDWVQISADCSFCRREGVQVIVESDQPQKRIIYHAAIDYTVALAK